MRPWTQGPHDKPEGPFAVSCNPEQSSGWMPATSPYGPITSPDGAHPDRRQELECH
jgi:hypothetical protein